MQDYSQAFLECKSVNECLKVRDDLSSSGEIQEIKDSFVTALPEEKKELGSRLSQLRNTLQEACDIRIKNLQRESEKNEYTNFDPTFYSSKYSQTTGAKHPITLIVEEVLGIFSKMGFDVFDGEQIVTQEYNFTIPNTPDYHPARAMQDTFFLKQKDEKGENYVMRTQVTANIGKYAELKKPPFRAIFPGIVFRNENMDATHDINFTQFDMWMIDKKTSISQLITLIKHFFSEFFNDPDLRVRLRPNYFPFTEPSLEGDISCPFCKGEGCRICKKTGWIEVFGAGPIDEAVLKNIGLNPNEYQGLAFGFGADRLAQLKLQISSLSQFYNGHLKFLKGLK